MKHTIILFLSRFIQIAQPKQVMMKILSRVSKAMMSASNNSLAVFYVTASSREEGEKVAGALVESKLAACCNIIDGVKSIYFWEGKVNADNEVMLVIKSRQSLIPKIAAKVKEVHSYDVPQVIAMPIIGGSEPYVKWVLQNTIEE